MPLRSLARPGVEAVTSGAPRSEEPVHTRGYRVIALVVASALFMQQLDGTVLTVALPTMARDRDKRILERFQPA